MNIVTVLRHPAEPRSTLLGRRSSRRRWSLLLAVAVLASAVTGVTLATQNRCAGDSPLGSQLLEPDDSDTLATPPPLAPRSRSVEHSDSS